MPREIRSLLLALACAGVVAAGCKQKSKEEADPGGAPSASAAPSATAEAPPPPDIIPPPITPPVAPVAASAKPVAAESIKGCCTALHNKESTATPQEKSMYTQAASSCDQISKLVASGTTKKASALTTLRAGLRGAALPAGCN